MARLYATFKIGLPKQIPIDYIELYHVDDDAITIRLSGIENEYCLEGDTYSARFKGVSAVIKTIKDFEGDHITSIEEVDELTDARIEALAKIFKNSIALVVTFNDNDLSDTEIGFAFEGTITLEYGNDKKFSYSPGTMSCIVKHE